jgi:hypothetical protein
MSRRLTALHVGNFKAVAITIRQCQSYYTGTGLV